MSDGLSKGPRWNQTIIALAVHEGGVQCQIGTRTVDIIAC